MYSLLKIVYLLVVIMISLKSIIVANGVNGEKIDEIRWNSSNPIFLHDNTNHVFNVRIRDSVDIICPKYEPSTPKHLVEYSIIHMVDRFGYDSCRTDNRTDKSPMLVGICTMPYMEQVITIVFREFTPNPSGLEFKPDHDYYFISTSNGTETGLYQKEGGLCETKNMKLRFDVKRRNYVINTPKPVVPVYSKKATKPHNANAYEDYDDNDDDATDNDNSDKEDYANNKNEDNDNNNNRRKNVYPPSPPLFPQQSGNDNDNDFPGSTDKNGDKKNNNNNDVLFPQTKHPPIWRYSHIYAVTSTMNYQNDKRKNSGCRHHWTFRLTTPLSVINLGVFLVYNYYYSIYG